MVECGFYYVYDDDDGDVWSFFLFYYYFEIYLDSNYIVFDVL